ncbi:MAG: hypothetical protein KDA77_09035 [Planctomycetaceae bacterium]|nr:hypothetical protein [Planctomycetaceae bacterium]
MNVTWEYIENQNGTWNVRFLNVEGEYELSGGYLLQCVGVIHEIDFYFRAKDQEWEFETNDEKGWLFPAADRRAFQRQGRYKQNNGLPNEKAAEIIAACVAEFLNQLTSPL